MKINKFNPYIPEEFKKYEEKILNTEFSKKGLSDFKKDTGMYLFVILNDKEYITTFDKSGTFPAGYNENGIAYDPTGAYINNKEGRKVSQDGFVKIYADVKNVFDFINFFENNKDVESLV